MNIQISIVLWTFICFFILLIILKNLLFKPVLKLLDDRNERISSAKEKQKQNEKIVEGLKEKFRIAATELKEKAKEEAERKVMAEQNSAEKMLEKTKINQHEITETYKIELKEQKLTLAKEIEEHSDRLVEKFIQGFVS